LIACPACGSESPEDFAFCPGCGTRLSSAPPTKLVPAPLSEERKVVTALFCDLVSFTEHSEASDHELVDGLLQRYCALAKRLVESHGGVVEKFIGDAVLAVFGFPAAHDDDAERAVRCALKLAAEAASLTWPDGDSVQVRIGVNTGEIFLHTDVDPASGETFLTGDAVNTAARLETAAPPGGVLAGALTRELTRQAIAYEELPPLTLKGKKEPVPAWLAKQVQSRTGLRTAGAADTPFVGRERELARLLAAFETAATSSQPQFCLIVGEPGIGKSRLLLELARALDQRPELITWRQGRCPPYGETIAFAALSEVVRMHTGILDSDDLALVETKLADALPESQERPWLLRRLRPLVGLESSEASREESFAAWTRFLGQLAVEGPAVIVFEDLHWADDGTLAFIEHLASHPPHAPLLLAATARPELVAKHPRLLAGGGLVERIPLSPLTRGQASRLVSALIEERLAGEVRGPILERAAGNPLYAEEYVRLLLDRGLLLRTQGVLRMKEGEELPLPDTVQAVLQARLDTLPRAHKALLCDAAIFGESFWDGALAALSDQAADQVRTVMGALVERQLVRPVTSSSLSGETEYLFWHAVARDVAYAQLPKKMRARKHERAALWLEEKAGDRTADFSQLLAHHFVTALDLARATAEHQLAASLLDPALRYLEMAAVRMWDLDNAAAERNLARALSLAPDNAPARPRLLAAWGIALGMGARRSEALPALEEAIPRLKATGERRKAAEALIYLGSLLAESGRPSRHRCFAEALALLDGDEPSPELAFVLFNSAILEMNDGRPERALELAEQAVAAAAHLDALWRSRALATLGMARCDLGDAGGLDDMREASSLAGDEGRSSTIVTGNYVQHLAWVEGPVGALEISRDFSATCVSRGLNRYAVSARGAEFELLSALGYWDDAAAVAVSLSEELSESHDAEDLIFLRGSLAILHARRGQVREADRLAAWVLKVTRDARHRAGLVASALAACAMSGRVDDGSLRSRLRDLTLGAEPDLGVSFDLPELVRAGRKVSAPAIARWAASWSNGLPLPRCVRRYAEAMVAESSGELEAATGGFADAAARWHEFSVPYEEAQALLGQGRCLVALGRAPEAAPALEAAREIFARLGARPALGETEALLAGAHSAGSPA
jgi:class 3 adenylate cyclase/tetratricopeptide (TPR) repeat protein